MIPWVVVSVSSFVFDTKNVSKNLIFLSPTSLISRGYILFIISYQDQYSTRVI